MRFALSTTVLVLLCVVGRTYANDSTSRVNNLANFPNRLFAKINRKTSDLGARLDKQTEVYLKRLSKNEAKLKTELYKKDSCSARCLFLNDPEQQYAAYVNKIRTDTTLNSVRPTGGQYLPYADSLQGSLSFLSKNPQLLSHSTVASAEVEGSVGNLQTLQGKMQQAEYSRQFVEERKEQIRQYIQMHANVSPAVSAIYSDYNKQLYYYQTQLNEYKDILNDPDKLLKTALGLLNKLPAFAAFMQKNSYLSGLFNVPDNYDMQGALPGMQTRDIINSMIDKQVAAGGAGAATSLNSSFEAAEGKLDQLKDKVTSFGAGGSNVDLPSNFQPNSQKVKTFFDRLVYGVDLQTVQSTYYLPATTTVGLSIGYKLNDKATIGVGAGYKIGWLSPTRKVSLSNQGASLRSYMDVKIKKSWYATGGFEYVYQPISGVHFSMRNLAKVSFLKDCGKWNGSYFGALQGLDPRRKDSASNLCFASYYKVTVPYEIIFVYKGSVKKRNEIGYPLIPKEFDQGCANMYANFNCFAFVLKMKDPSLQDDPNFTGYSFPTVVKAYRRISEDRWSLLKQVTVKSYSEYRRLQFKTIYGLF
jgi:hypothetical protein